MLKNKSYFKRSTGDEAGSAPKKGVVTSQTMGKVYFNAWSMDVKIEGENVVRMLDITTHNHGSVPGNSPTWPYIDEASTSPVAKACAEDKAKEEKACKGCLPAGSKDPCSDDKEAKECQKARQCQLVPKKSTAEHVKPGENACCPGKTGHHLIPKSYCKGMSKGNATYSESMAPCICVDGPNQRTATHGQVHSLQEAAVRKLRTPQGTINYKKMKRIASRSARWVFVESGCDPKCIEAQLDAYHNQVGIDDSTDLSTTNILGKNEASPRDILEIGRRIRARLGG